MKKIISILISVLTIAVGSAFAKQDVVVENASTFAHIPAPIKKAKWICPEPNSLMEINNVYAVFRKTFTLGEVPQKAHLFITADQNYRLWVNGKFVCSGPARGYQRSMPYDELDISKYLKNGKNVLAVRVYNAGRSTFSYLTQGSFGLLFALDLGKGKTIVSDSTTLGHRQSGCDRDTAWTSIQTCHQEHIDLREENPEWMNEDFDDSSWKKYSIGMRIFNSMPYYNFEARMIPMLEEFEINTARLVASGTTESKCDGRFRNLNQLADIEKGKLNAAKGGATVDVPPSGKGKVGEYLFDFGVLNVGFPVLKIEGAKGGEIVDAIYVENINPNFQILNKWNTHSAPAFGNRIICREGNQRHQFHQTTGFRYVLVRVRGNAGDLKITPSMIWSAYPMEDKGAFNVSNSDVQKIWQACRQTQKICALDSYVDTPHREQAHWWGDARVQSWNMFFIANDARLLRRGIHIISMQTLPNGLTYGLAPTMAHTCVLPDYTLTWLLTLFDHYWQTGTPEAYINHRDIVDGILSYFEHNKDMKTGLLKYDNRYWLFLDWCGIQKSGQPSLLNLWYLHALEKLEQLCRENNLNSDAKRYGELAKTIRAAIEKNLVLDSGLISDGILPNGKINRQSSIHNQVVGKFCNIKGFDFAKAKTQLILPFIRGDETFKVMPSSYWVVYVLQALIDDGNAEDAYNFIKRKWKPFADFGTTFETYADKIGHMSYSHAWSAHPAFLLPQILGGIKQESAAWKKVSVNPNFFEDSADIKYPTPQGDLKVSYKKKADGTFDLKVDVPKNMQLVK